MIKHLKATLIIGTGITLTGFLIHKIKRLKPQFNQLIKTGRNSQANLKRLKKQIKLLDLSDVNDDFGKFKFKIQPSIQIIQKNLKQIKSLSHHK